jgi:hypothetical protein
MIRAQKTDRDMVEGRGRRGGGSYQGAFQHHRLMDSASWFWCHRLIAFDRDRNKVV